MSYALRLPSDGLLYKYGFNDGDVPDELLDVLDERGLPYPKDWHAALRVLVREHLLPALDQRVDAFDIETNHNPIRALTIDGVEVKGQQTVTGAAIRLTPAYVEVPVDRVIEVIQAVELGEQRAAQ